MDPAQPPEPDDLRADRGLVHLARGLVGDAHATEDVLQDSWLVARRRPPGLPERRGGWLRGIVRRVAHKYRRMQRRNAGEPSADAHADEFSPADRAEQQQLLETIRAAVEALDEPYRTTIRLRYLEELSYAEIAERLRKPDATLRTHVMRGLAELRERIARTRGSPPGAPGS